MKSPTLKQLYSTALAPLLSEALDLTTKELVAELVDIIDKEVYSYPNTWTNGCGGERGRTGEFGESWKSTKPIILNQIVTSEIIQDALIHHPPFSHGSFGDVLTPAELDNIINNGIEDTNVGFPSMEGRPFWDSFMVYVDTNLDKIFLKNCKVVGLPIKAGIIKI